MNPAALALFINPEALLCVFVMERAWLEQHRMAELTKIQNKISIQEQLSSKTSI